MAKNYNRSEYALNKFSDSIVYSGSDGAYELTKEAFLASDPTLTEEDFKYWKHFSDKDYLNSIRKDTFESKHTVFIDDVPEAALASDQSTVDEVLEEMEPTPNPYTYANALRVLDCCLTPVQKRRYLLYVCEDMTLRQIASLEGVGYSKIQKSINQAKEKIKKFCSEGVQTALFWTLGEGQ